MALYRACAALPHSCWNELYPSEDICEDDLKNGLLYVSDGPDGPCAAVSLLPWDDVEDEGLPFAPARKPCVMGRLCLTPPRHGKGEGRALLAMAEDEARALGYDAMHLLCDVENHPATAMYLSAGYLPVGKAVMYGHTYEAFEKKL